MIKHRTLLRLVAAVGLLAGLRTAVVDASPGGPSSYCDLSLSRLSTNAPSTCTVPFGATVQVTCAVSINNTRAVPASNLSSCNVVLSVNGVAAQSARLNPCTMAPSSTSTFTFNVPVTQAAGSTVTYTCEVNPASSTGSHSTPETSYTNNAKSVTLTISQ